MYYIELISSIISIFFLAFFFNWVFSQEKFVNVGNDTTSSNGSFNKNIEFFVSSDSQLEMSGGYSSHFEIL